MMKKTVLILVAALICSLTFAQQDIWLDSLTVSDIAGSDTVIWKAEPVAFSDFGGSWSVDVEYSGLDADDATISLGGGNYADSTWSALDHDDIPFTLDVTTNAADVNGVSKTSKGFYGYYWPFISAGFKIDPGSVTSGIIIIKWIQTY